jgi:hypothetical protein
MALVVVVEIKVAMLDGPVQVHVLQGDQTLNPSSGDMTAEAEHALSTLRELSATALAKVEQRLDAWVPVMQAVIDASQPRGMDQ